MKWLLTPMMVGAAVRSVQPVTPEVIVFGFPAADSNTSSWLQWDWERITTVVLIHTPPAGLVSFAHKNNVKVMQNVGLSKKATYSPLTNLTARNLWIQTQLATVRRSMLHAGRSTGGRSTKAAPQGPLHGGRSTRAAPRGGSQIFFILTCAQY